MAVESSWCPSLRTPRRARQRALPGGMPLCRLLRRALLTKAICAARLIQEGAAAAAAEEVRTRLGIRLYIKDELPACALDTDLLLEVRHAPLCAKCLCVPSRGWHAVR